jgi:glycosyltransferase involved in cell wall biosynthesis
LPEQSVAHLSVVIPVYKAEACLEELYRRLAAALGSITDDFEIVMVEDCGGDRSWDIIRALAARDPRVKGLQFSRNFGQHYGITAGLDHCDGDWVVIMDCDLQDRPEEIPRLYAKAQEGWQVVIARRGRRRDPWHKRLVSWAFYKTFQWLADIPHDARTSNFRILSRKVVLGFRQVREQLRFLGGIVTWLGYPTATVDVEHGERHAGRSAYTLMKLWKLASETIIAYSDKPLRLAIRFGFALASLAFLYGIYIVVHAIRYGSVITGWASLIVSIYFLGGIIIAILGVMGIYIGKVFDETKKRPLYVVMRSTADE